jgi:hypothetical protein
VLVNTEEEALVIALDLAERVVQPFMFFGSPRRQAEVYGAHNSRRPDLRSFANDFAKVRLTLVQSFSVG